MRSIFLFAAFFLFAAPACGGRVILAAADSGPGSGNEDPSDDGGLGDPSPSQPGSPGKPSPPPGSPFPICPGTQPKPGWACPTPNQGCAYVNVQEHTCASVTCGENYEWAVSTPAGC
jgi:hypothetical protein